MPYFCFDLIIAAVLLFALLRGYRRGFVLTLCGLLAVFVALIGASVVSHMLAEPVSRSIQPIVEQHIQQLLEEQLPAQADADTPDSDELDTALDDILEQLKASSIYKVFAETVQQAVDSGMVAASANGAKLIAAYAARQLAQLILFLLSFVLILILWFFLSHALDLAFHLPVLSTLNRWCGAVLGLLKGALLVYTACWLLKDSFIPQEAIQTTYLLRPFCTVSLMTLLF